MNFITIAVLAIAAIAIYIEWHYRKRTSKCPSPVTTDSKSPVQIKNEQDNKKQEDKQENEPGSESLRGEYMDSWCNGADEIGHCTDHGYQNCPQHLSTSNIDPDTIPADHRCLGRAGTCECPEHTLPITSTIMSSPKKCNGSDEIGYCATHGYKQCTNTNSYTKNTLVTSGYNYIKRIGNAFATPVHDYSEY